MEQMIFSDGSAIVRTVFVGVLAYVTLIAFLRLAGKRILSKMNAFDFVVTVALGSTLATALLSPTATLVNVALAFAVLIGLQFAVTWSSVRARWVRKVVTGAPLMLLHAGKSIPSAMKNARVTEEEVRAAVRAAGAGALGEVAAVVLETDGSFSVIRRVDDGNASSLEGVQKPITLH